MNEASREDGPVLVTGADGFVGRAVCEALSSRGRPFRMLVRSEPASPPPGGAVFRTRDLLDEEVLRAALEGCGSVIHLAARVHMMNDRAADPLAEFRRVNVLGARLLAAVSAAMGVRRFVFASSVKVNGESTTGRPFRETDDPAPEDPYGKSKWEAERALAEVASETALEVVVLRPPLMYGAGVKANFLRLMRLVDRGVPIPLGAARNQRNLVFVRNFADAVVLAADHAGAAGETFMISDAPPVSTAELVRHIARALGRRARLVPVPTRLLRVAGVVVGKRPAVDRLLESLRVDSGRVREVLGWTPPFSMEEGLRETVDWYRASQERDAV